MIWIPSNAVHAHRRTAQQVYDAQAAAFNVATVTKRFYDQYRGHYERAKAAIATANPGVRDFYADAVGESEFMKRQGEQRRINGW